MYFVAPATIQNAVVCQTQQYMYLILYYISAVYIVRWIQQHYVCMVVTYSKSMDQPGKVANPTSCGQLKRENEYCPVRVRAWEFGRARRVRQSRPASACSSPYSGWIWCLHTYGIPPDFRSGVQTFWASTSSGRMSKGLGGNIGCRDKTSSVVSLLYREGG